jgi:LuxR family maltose regulon positive regulatory protein
VGDFEAADELVQAESAALIGQGRWKVVVEWIEALPGDRVARRQWLLHWPAVVSPLLSDPAVHIFRRIFAWAVICWYTCNVSDYELGEHAIAASEALARDEGMHIAERFACILGYFLDMDRRDHAAGRRRIDRFERIMIPSQPYEAASLVNMKSWFGVYTEDAGPTRQHASEAVRLYTEAGSIPHIMVGCNALIWGCVESQDEAGARRAIAEHRKWSCRRNLEWACWAPDAGEAILAMRAGDEVLLRDRLGKVFGAERHRLDQYGHQFAWCRGWASTLSAEALRRGIEPERVRRFIREFDLEPSSPEIEAWPWPIKITTLGRFELCVDGEPLSFGRKPPRKTLALVKALVAMGSRNVKDYQIIGALWRDQEGDVARDAFRVALHRLRKLLGQSEAVLADEGRLTLNPSRCWIDAVAFEELVQRQHGAAEAGASAEILLRLYRGPFLADEHDEPWAAAMRARPNGKFVGLVSKLGAALEQGGNFEAAMQLYLQGIDADPVGESFYQGLMRCYRDSGKPAEAIGVYRRLRQTLSLVLNIQPNAASEALRRDLLILAG